MCGICGVINYTGISSIEKNLIEKMNECLVHRGPDDCGVFFDKNLGLGHRRLAILDLSVRAHQPMSFKERYTIAYNGEVYNFEEIKTRLESKGYSFCSCSDTEVILAAYDYYGINCLKLFNGMWAFALWDHLEKRLLLARDRFGVKPLYYYRNQDYFIFASEIKALLCDSRIERKANDKLVFDFLENGIVDHTDETFFKNIYKIPQGSYMFVYSEEKKTECCRYFKLDFSNKITDDSPSNRKKFKNLFFKSVSRRLRSDVPTGSCLSGGLDSSAIVCTVDRIAGKNHKQHTFSFCAEEKGIDEKEYMETVVRETHVIPHYIYSSHQNIVENFKKLVFIQDEPFTSASILASYFVYKKAGDLGIKVLLDGQGADELLCGYRKSRIYYIRSLMKNGNYLNAISEFLLAVPQIKTSFDIKEDINKIIRILNIEHGKRENRYLKKCESQEKVYLDYNEDFQFNDIYKISLPALLRYADRNSMAASVESRLPFLDYQFAEFCSQLPLTEKINKGYSKVILRKSIYLPKKIKKRKDKLGFIAPETNWMKKNEKFFRSFFDSSDFKAGRYIKRENVLNDWKELVGGRNKNLLFRMISLEAWMQEFKVQ